MYLVYMKEERKKLENAFKSRIILFEKIKLAESQFFTATTLFVGECFYYRGGEARGTRKRCGAN